MTGRGLTQPYLVLRALDGLGRLARSPVIALGALLRHPGMSIRMVVEKAEQHSHQLFRHRDAALVDEIPQPLLAEADAVIPGTRAAEANLIRVEQRRNAQPPLGASKLTGVIQAGQRFENRFVPGVAPH